MAPSIKIANAPVYSVSKAPSIANIRGADILNIASKVCVIYILTQPLI